MYDPFKPPCWLENPPIDPRQRLSDHIEYIPVEGDIDEPVTKFGGQPHWLEEPQWPLSRWSGDPLIFVGQVALDPELFPGGAGKMAYFFLRDTSNHEGWEAYSGDCAVIIQPGGDLDGIDTVRSATGPTVTTTRHVDDQPVVESITYRVVGDRRDEGGYRSEQAVLSVDHDTNIAAWELQWPLEGGDKIGGLPNFSQAEEFPDCDRNWSLLFQLYRVPFDLPTGFGCVGYGMIDDDLTRGASFCQ